MAADLHVTPRALEDRAAKILVAAGAIKTLKDAAALAGAPVKLVEDFFSTTTLGTFTEAMNAPSP